MLFDFLPLKKFIPMVESRLSGASFLYDYGKECPYIERNMSFLGDTSSLLGLLD
jgi:hypothetical protein